MLAGTSRTWHRCFPVNFAKFLETFFTEHLQTTVSAFLGNSAVLGNPNNLWKYYAQTIYYIVLFRISEGFFLRIFNVLKVSHYELVFFYDVCLTNYKTVSLVWQCQLLFLDKTSHLISPWDIKILGWCPAGSVFPHGENVPR